VVESTRCYNCTSPVTPGQAFCANCGASLAVPERPADPVTPPGFDPAPADTTPEPALPDPAPAPANPTPAPGLDPALLSDPTGGAAAANAIPDTDQSPPAVVTPSSWAMQPSSAATLGVRRMGSSPILSVGAVPVSPQSMGTAVRIEQPQPAAFAPAEVAPARKVPVQELVAFGLSAAGAAVGIASFLLPWTGANGIGIGTTQAGASNQWAFAMPAGIPLLLITALVLGGVAGSDRIQLEIPKLASVIGRVTDLILPMLLGGLYLGVVILYATLPWGYGMGLVVLLVAAALLVAGSIVSIIFPPEPATKLE
jgi:hypothetical protein